MGRIMVDKDFIDLIIQEIEKQIGKKILFKYQAYDDVESVLTNMKLVYQKYDSDIISYDNNIIDSDLAKLVHINVTDIDGNKHDIDVNLIVGELIKDSFHEILVQYHTFLRYCDIMLTLGKPIILEGGATTLQDGVVSFKEPDHLFGLPDSYSQRITYHKYRTSRYGDFIYPGVNETIRDIFESDRYPVNRISLDLGFSSLEKIYSILINRRSNLLLCVDAPKSLEDFCSLIKTDLVDILASGDFLSDDDRIILQRYLEKLASDCTEDDYKEKMHDKIEHFNFELLVEARDSIYLENSFLHDCWALIVFLKNSKQDEYWYDKLNDAFFNDNKANFNNILYNFYKKYANYLPVDHFKKNDIDIIANRIYSILEGNLSVKKGSTESFVKDSFALSLPGSLQRYDQLLIDSFFWNLSDFSKAMLYSDYKIYKFLYDDKDEFVRYHGDASRVYVFDLLLGNNLLDVLRKDSSEKVPNFIKIWNKLNIINYIVKVVRENIYKARFIDSMSIGDEELRMRFAGLEYGLNPIKVTLSKHKGSQACFDIQFYGEQLQIEIKQEDNGNDWNVISIKIDNKGNEDKIKSVVLNGGRY